MSTSYTFPKNASTGKLYTKDGKVIAFVGDPALYDGDWFRKSVTISTNAIVRAHVVESGWKGDLNITYDINYDLSPYSGVWTLANDAIPPFDSIGQSGSNNWYTTASIPSVSATLSGISVTPLHGTLDYGTPGFNGGAGPHNYYNRLRINQTNLGRWYILLGCSTGVAIRMIYKTSDMAYPDDYSKQLYPVRFEVTKANSLAAGHSVRGSYSIAASPLPFSHVSGSFTVSA